MIEAQSSIDLKRQQDFDTMGEPETVLPTYQYLAVNVELATESNHCTCIGCYA